MEKVTFEIWSSLLKSVKELNEHMTKDMRDLTHDNVTIKSGWKLGTITVTLPEGKEKIEVKSMIEKDMCEKTNQEIWLKEVAYDGE